MAAVISIGCQEGGPQGSFIGAEMVALYRVLAKHVTSTHCPAVDEYALILRVDGSLDKFGKEGLARLRFARSRRYITVDIQVPEAAWQPLNRTDTRHYMAMQVQAAMSAFDHRLVKDKNTVNESLLAAELDAAIHEYLNAD